MALKGNGLRPGIWNCDITDSWKGRRPQWRGLSESVREQSAMPRFEDVTAMVSIGVNEDGHREVIGCAEGFTESKECWRGFLSWLKSRGLRGFLIVVGDKATGMVGSIA